MKKLAVILVLLFLISGCGKEGPMGATGLTGATGANGVNGDKGDKGDTGNTGATGSSGSVTTIYTGTLTTNPQTISFPEMTSSVSQMVLYSVSINESIWNQYWNGVTVGSNTYFGYATVNYVTHTLTFTVTTLLSRSSPANITGLRVR